MAYSDKKGKADEGSRGTILMPHPPHKKTDKRFMDVFLPEQMTLEDPS